MRRTLLLSALVLALQALQSPLAAMVQTGVVADQDDEYYDDCYSGWDGPGFYYGIWFDSPDAYCGWVGGGGIYYSGGYYGRDHDHHDHGGDHGHGGGGHGHGGGGHGGGGHGGGHGGGGHH